MEEKQQEENDEPSAPFWMVTYGDMVTLLLTFFILLLSFAELDEVKFEEAAHSLKGALGVMQAYESPKNNKSRSKSSSELEMMRRNEMYKSMVELEALAKEMGYEDDVSIMFSDNGLLIRMGDRVLFDIGKAYLKPKALPVLDIVGKAISKHAKEVLVGGHTDDYPIQSAEFPSNWELSASRALNVVKYLIDRTGVKPHVLAATGYSEFRPLVGNSSAENRRKNRRVEFLVTWN